MVGSSKILTVSYGTFSCTLEGFDDSFSTMKAIAEYFRDLAADDRYFGAEPPTPDAEMLARIAEREIARRVEARTEGTGIVLKAGQALASPARPDTSDDVAGVPGEPVAEEEAPVAEAAPEAEARAVNDAAEVAPPEVPAVDDAADDLAAAAEAQDDGQAEALSEEAAAEPAAARDAAAVDYEEDDTDPLDYEVAASKLAESLSARPTPHRVAPHRVMPPAPAASGDDEEDAEPAAAPLSDMPPALTAPPVHPDADSVAAKLERIRAVVGKARQQGPDRGTDASRPFPAPSGPTTGYDEDEPETIDPDLSTGAPQVEPAPRTEAASFAPRPVRTRVIKMSIADFQRSVSQGQLEPVEDTDDSQGEDMGAAGQPSEARNDVYDDDGFGDFGDFEDYDDRAADDAASDDAIEEISDEDLAHLAALDGARPEEASGDTARDGDTIDAEDDDTLWTDEDDDTRLTDEEEAELLAELADLQRDEETGWGAELPSDGPADEAASGSAADQAHSGARDDDMASAVAQDAVAQDAVAQDAAIAEVADVPSRAEEPAASGDDAEGDEDEDEDEAPLNLFGGSDDEEDDAFEAENAIYSGDDEDDEDDVETDPRALRRQRAFESSPDTDSGVVSRLIEQTDDQLNHPETNRRRESMTQLKAAVAATEAARQMGEPDSKRSGSDDEFRNDLRQAVRPRRPTRPADRPAARTERPQTAPLKLVASQRVDIEHEPARPAGPVRPRRVRLDETGSAEATRESGSFAAFARDMGAQGLAELLEAAAAYTAYVEGSEDFSRPQIMSKVRGMTERDFSREEGLRSFGRLLREGRIMKVRNGRFQISDETRFHPERRAG